MKRKIVIAILEMKLDKELYLDKAAAWQSYGNMSYPVVVKVTIVQADVSLVLGLY